MIAVGVCSTFCNFQIAHHHNLHLKNLAAQVYGVLFLEFPSIKKISVPIGTINTQNIISLRNLASSQILKSPYNLKTRRSQSNIIIEEDLPEASMNILFNKESI